LILNDLWAMDKPSRKAETIGIYNAGGTVNIENYIVSKPQYNPAYNLPYPPSLNFVGREGVLEKLHNRLQTGSCAIATSVAGMAGVGKTELALQYAKKYGESFGGGCYWLGLRDRKLVDVLVQHIKDEFDLDLPPDKIDFQEISKWCWRQWERNLPANSAVLVVLDNVDETQQIGGMLPGNTRFRLLVTTRRHALDATFAEELLAELENPEALKLLKKFVELRVLEEPEAAQQLCHELLGNLPLGIELAGRYLQQDSELSITDFVSELSILHESLDRENTRAAYPTMTADRGVRLALELSWRKLNLSTQTVAKILGLCALHAIPWELATSMAESATESSITVQKSRQQLENLHLIKWDSERRTATLHALVRNFLQLQIGDDITLQQIVTKIIVQRAKKVEEVMILEKIEALQDIVPHIKEVATRYSAFLSDDKFEWLFTGIARFYNSQGLYGLAEPWYNKCLELTYLRLGNDNPTVANSLNNLAVIYRTQGRYSEAEIFYEKALLMREKYLGATHLSVAEVLHNLAILYWDRGRYDDSESLHIRVLAIREEQLDSDNIIIAKTFNGLAVIYREKGDYTKSENFHVKALSIQKKNLGFEHPEVLQTLNSLAVVYCKKGKYIEAESLHQDILQLRKRQLGCKHIYTAQTFNSLAMVNCCLKRYEEAKENQKLSLEIREERLGCDHPYVASSLHYLGEIHHFLKYYAEAKECFVKAREIWKINLGTQHTAFATSSYNLAMLYGSQGMSTEAEEYANQAFLIFKEKLGDAHPDTRKAKFLASGLQSNSLLFCDRETMNDMMKDII
jgi:tetratricopeptide (TPR) repeat protein